MSNTETPFEYLDVDAIDRLEIKTQPYQWGYISDAIPHKFMDEVLSDAPVITTRGSYPIKSFFGLPRLKFGPRFGKVVEELLSDRFREIVGKKLNMDLSKNPPCIVMMGNTTGHYNEGYAHPDSKHKIVTVLIGFTREWPYEKGRLRILRSSDRNDFEFEFAPEFGCMLMFKVSDKSWHGFLPQKGPRMSLQLCYYDCEASVRREYFRHGLSALVKSVPTLDKILSLLPKNMWGIIPSKR
ncbi:MAG: 2OG-Fe(II) oxygenase [Alphaproteobacteria bacterium]|nr:2OG-Fe(II) oxygenase [Alphaproteobacteria bacterium]